MLQFRIWKYTFNLDSSGIVKKKELARIYKLVRDEVHASAKKVFNPGEERILAYARGEAIVLPPSSAGTVLRVMFRI